MVQAKPGDTVKVHYVGKLADGTVFSNSTNRAAVLFTVGEGKAIIFEKAVVGMSPGESKTIHVPAYQAYGPYRKEMVMMVDRQQLPKSLTPKVGQRLQLSRGDDRTVNVTVIDVSEASITLDANHPLAGKDLTYDIQLMDIVLSNHNVVQMNRAGVENSL
jgi:peptidylprolyl isomerase